MTEPGTCGSKKLWNSDFDNDEVSFCMMNKTFCSCPNNETFFRREQRPSQWENLLAQVSFQKNTPHNPTHLIYPTIRRAKKLFPTGSQYDGTWDVFGMSGTGTYTFPHGIIYEGEFKDGTFHGYGELKYPNGITVKGRFSHGVMTERSIVFSDGVEFEDGEWNYTKMPDRRFSIEFKGLAPAGRSFMTATQPPHDIPEGFYDTGDGFYDPKTKSVFQYDDVTFIIRTVEEEEHNWIVENCRKSSMGPLGSLPELYEEWSEPIPDMIYDLIPNKKTVAEQIKQSVDHQDDIELKNELVSIFGLAPN